MAERHPPGAVRDAIIAYLRERQEGATVAEVRAAVADRLSRDVPASSVRSYLGNNTGSQFERLDRGCYRMKDR